MAQEARSISGKIVNDSLENSAVHIINLSQKSGTLTSRDGSFFIMAREKDTLLFSSLLYVPKKIIVSSAIFNGSPLNVELGEFVNELEEVNISNIALTGNLDADLDNIKVVKNLPMDIRFSDVKHARFESDVNDLKKAPRNLAYEGNMVVKPGSTFGVAVNFDHLTDLISGKHSLNKKAKANQDLAFLVEDARNIFSEEFFVQQLNLPSEEIIGFLFYCAENADLKQQMQRNNELHLMEYLEKQAPEFRAHRELE